MERTISLKKGRATVALEKEKRRSQDREDSDGLLEGLIASIQSTFEKYKDQLEHVRACKELLAEAAEGGEFSAEELEELQRGVEQQSANAQPLIDQLAEQITLAQKSWRRKKAAIDSVGSLLSSKQQEAWNARHDKLADDLDALVEQLQI